MGTIGASGSGRMLESTWLSIFLPSAVFPSALRPGQPSGRDTGLGAVGTSRCGVMLPGPAWPTAIGAGVAPAAASSN